MFQVNNEEGNFIVNLFMTEAPIRFANQWTGYIIGASVRKKLISTTSVKSLIF